VKFSVATGVAAVIERSAVFVERIFSHRASVTYRSLIARLDFQLLSLKFNANERWLLLGQATMRSHCTGDSSMSLYRRSDLYGHR
jgi:hypothetical protein